MPDFVARAAMQKDLQALSNFTKVNHPSPFYTHSESQIDSFQKVLIEALPDSLAVIDFWRVTQKMINFFNDGHTRIRFTSFYRDYVKGGGTFFPMQVRFEDNNLMIINDLKEQLSYTYGDQISSINGVASNILQEEMKLFSRGENEEVDVLNLNRNFQYYLWLAYGWEGPFEIAIQKINGTKEKIKVEGLSLETYRQAINYKPPRKEITYHEQLNDSVMYYYIKDFYSTSKKNYKKRFDNFFKLLKEKPHIKYLIIDNRTNDGGDDIYAEYLCRYFANEPFRSAKTSYWYVTPQFKKTFKRSFIPAAVRWILPIYLFNKHTRSIYLGGKKNELAEVKKSFTKPFPEKKQFGGEVIMLNDVGTFSAASMFAAMFKDFNMGTIIGRPTGNISSFYANDIMRGRLSNSRIPIEVSTSYNVRPNGDESLNSIQPDIYVKEGKDILEFALEWIANQYN